jgi:multimeric flavodoxin WrbA
MEAVGCRAETVFLPPLCIERCRQCDDNGWGLCRKEGRCVIEDDFAAVADKLRAADVVVFATPVYFMGISAQLKRVIDRMFSLFKYDDEKGRSYAPGLRETALALIATAGGGDDDGLDLVNQNVEIIARFTGLTFRSLLVPNAHTEHGVRAENAELRERAGDFGRDLAK